MKHFLTALLTFLSIATANAQTSPNLRQGQVLTPAQWNALFAGKQDYTGGPTAPTSADILATTTNNSAATGYIGQYTASVIASGSAVSLTNATPANLTSISLEAGDWDVSVKCNFKGAATTLVATLACGISTTSATFDTTNGRSAFTYVSGGTAALYNAIAGGFPPPTVSVSSARLSLSGTTTVYATAGSQFTTSTSAVYGVLSARRPR